MINTISREKFINKKINLKNWIEHERSRPTKFSNVDAEPSVNQFFELCKPNTLNRKTEDKSLD